jgi:hypothetical protein
MASDESFLFWREGSSEAIKIRRPDIPMDKREGSSEAIQRRRTDNPMDKRESRHDRS